jgi:hypothetical protein
VREGVLLALLLERVELWPRQTAGLRGVGVVVRAVDRLGAWDRVVVRAVDCRGVEVRAGVWLTDGVVARDERPSVRLGVCRDGEFDCEDALGREGVDVLGELELLLLPESLFRVGVVARGVLELSPRLVVLLLDGVRVGLLTDRSVGAVRVVERVVVLRDVPGVRVVARVSDDVRFRVLRVTALLERVESLSGTVARTLRVERMLSLGVAAVVMRRSPTLRALERVPVASRDTVMLFLVDKDATRRRVLRVIPWGAVAVRSDQRVAVPVTDRMRELRAVLATTVRPPPLLVFLPANWLRPRPDSSAPARSRAVSRVRPSNSGPRMTRLGE